MRVPRLTAEQVDNTITHYKVTNAACFPRARLELSWLSLMFVVFIHFMCLSVVALDSVHHCDVQESGKILAPWDAISQEYRARYRMMTQGVYQQVSFMAGLV